eukprot:6003900-Amphidinium_carterae.1
MKILGLLTRRAEPKTPNINVANVDASGGFDFGSDGSNAMMIHFGGAQLYERAVGGIRLWRLMLRERVRERERSSQCRWLKTQISCASVDLLSRSQVGRFIWL